ncbi:MAG: alpha,2-mannosyltransferase [Micromonosporaceae bacterium]|nr:alpha,2-mannosyltransferase [Micromonosporaceae bacterium]
MSVGAPPQTPPTRSPTRRQISLLAAVAAVVVAAHVWYGNRHNFYDLRIYAAAMRWWDAGHPLYDFVKADDTQGRLGYTYPPFAAIVMRPLAWLPLGLTIAIYVVVSVAALAASVWWLVRPLAVRHRVPPWFALGLAFVLASALEPIREAFTFGQINVVLWALILFDLLVVLPLPNQHRWSRFAGVGIGLATAIKLVPGIFIVYLLVTRRFRAAAVAAGIAVAATLLAAAFSPAQSWTFWTDKVLQGDGVGQLAYEFNQSILGVLARLALPGQPNQALWILIIAPVLGYGMWRASRAAAAGDEVAGLTLAGLVGSLVSPVTWAHHIFWIVPALVVLVDTALRPEPAPLVSGLRRRAGQLTLAAVAYLTITVSLVALWSFALHKPGGLAAFVMSNWYVWLMLAMLPLLPIRRQTQPRPAADPVQAEVAQRP